MKTVINKYLKISLITRILISIIAILLFVFYLFNNQYKHLWLIFVSLAMSNGVIGYFEKCPNCKKSLLFHKPGEKIQFGIPEKCPYCNYTLKK